MKLGDLVRHKATEYIGLVLKDDTVDDDGLYLVHFPFMSFGPHWFEDEEVEVINENR